jgi:hypothetical protein
VQLGAGHARQQFLLQVERQRFAAADDASE